MRLTASSRTGALCILLLPVFVTGRAAAADGRDFAGNYSLTRISRQDGSVRVTLTMRVVNSSGADLSNAAIEVHTTGPGAELMGRLPAARAWAANHDVVATGDFTLTPEEFQRWCSRSPGVFVVYTDGQGGEKRGWVQLSRRPFIGGASQASPPAATEE